MSPLCLAVGSLRYDIVSMATNTIRAARYMSKYMRCHRKPQWKAAKWIMKDLKSTQDACLCFKPSNQKLKEIVVLDLDDDVNNMKSNICYMFTCVWYYHFVMFKVAKSNCTSNQKKLNMML